MAFCTSCGAELDGSFCKNCGARADAPAQDRPPQPPGPRKNKLLVWALAGCGGLLVIAAVAAIALGLFVKKKASEFGENPAFTAAKLAASMNPDVEVVDADEGTGKITLREKKTGKTVTIDFRDVQKGRISFEGDEGEKVEIGGEGSLAKVPEWVPKYPGGEVAGTFTTQGGAEEGGTFHLKCGDSAGEVAAFFERELKAAGMKVEKHSMQSGDSAITMITGAGDADRRTVNVTVTSTAEGAVAQVVYQVKK